MQLYFVFTVFPTFVNKTDKVLTLSIAGYIDTVERCEIKSHTSRKVQDSKICDTQGQDLNRNPETLPTLENIRSK
jgi:hypothetical protein